ncbi:MAG: hypothetical protein WEC75_00870 [Dehalococcoidia bacterium]
MWSRNGRGDWPDKHAPEYNRLVGSMRAASGDLSLLITTIDLMVEQLEVRYGWLMTLYYWGITSALLVDLLPRPSARVSTLLTTAPLRLADDPPDLSPDPEGKPDMTEAAAALVERLRTGIAELSGAVAALDVVLGELSADFDGEDLLHAEVRAMLDHARDSLEELASQMETFGEVGLEAADPKVPACARKIIERETGS